MAEDERAYANTDRELWREGSGDGNGMSYYEPSIHVTEEGRIGINVGGYVFVKTLREWHKLAERDYEAQGQTWLRRMYRWLLSSPSQQTWIDSRPEGKA